jgi:tetratricopeptide (TPR) repeat protein
MLKQFNRFLFLAIITSLILYITLTNSETATIKLGPSLKVSTYAGVIYVAVFAVGCVMTSLVALFFGLKGYLRERKLRANERSRQIFFELLVKARGLMASKEWGAAREIWEKVIRHEPSNVIARVELAECLENLGDPREALRILDETRASVALSTEVLFKAAELTRQLGNNTAASDNISLIVREAPSRAALEMARDNSEQLGNFDAALDYQLQLERMGFRDGDVEARKTSLLCNQLVNQKHSEVSALSESLTAFIKRHPKYAPALDKLGDVYLSLGKYDEAAENFVKAAKLNRGELSRWEKVIDLWLTKASGDFISRANRAIAAARSCCQDAKGLKRLDAELLLAKTLLQANRPEEAQKTVQGLGPIAEREGVRLPQEIVQKSTALLGLSLARLGQTRESAALWQQLVEPSGASTGTASPKGSVPSQDTTGPSPVLSTP